MGNFRLKRPAQIIDLTQPMRLGNPFSAEDSWEAEETGELLQAFGAELAAPLSRADRPASDYKASQVICRTIRRAGYDGIRYPSAMRSGGTNLVFFDPKIAKLVSARLVVVNALNLSFEDDERTKPRS